MEPATLIDLLNSQSYDSNRNKILSSVVSILPQLTLPQLASVVGYYTYDDSRVAAIEKLVNASKVMATCPFIEMESILDQMTYDPGRVSVVRYLSWNLYTKIPLANLNRLMGCFTYDTGRTEIFNLYCQSPLQITDVDAASIINGMSVFTYDQGRLNLLEKTKECLTTITSKDTFSDLVNSFTYDQNKIAKMLLPKCELKHDDLCSVMCAWMDENTFAAFCDEYKVSNEIVEKYKPKTLTVGASVTINGVPSGSGFSVYSTDQNGNVIASIVNGNVTVGKGATMHISSSLGGTTITFQR